MPEMSERIAELRRELESNPLSRQFYQLGELLRRDGRAAEAIAALRAGLRHHPRYVAAWVSLGRACLDRTEPKAAADALHEALELDAQNPVAWRLLGEARLGGGDRFGALDAMEHALQLAPGDEVLRAAVDSLASETWPPAAAPAAAAAGSQDAAKPTALAEPPATAMAATEVAPPQLVTLAVPAASPGPFAGTAPLPASAAPPAVDLADPFTLPLSISAADASADVFALPVEAPSFADEPFGFAAAPAPPQAEFLDELAPLRTIAPQRAAAPAVFEPGAFAAEPIPAPEIVSLPVTIEQIAQPQAVAAPFVEPVAEPTAGEIFPETVPEPPPAREVYAEVAAPKLEAPAVEPPPAVAAVPVSPGSAAAGSRPTLTMARLYLQQQDFPAAIAILERMVTSDPDNQEARDLLDLVHDMMAPLPGELPLASVRERKIAALQGWLASLTLGQERVGR